MLRRLPGGRCDGPGTHPLPLGSISPATVPHCRAGWELSCGGEPRKEGEFTWVQLHFRANRRPRALRNTGYICFL